MIITENTILFLCFFITFGFIGYKTIGLIKKKLDKYSENIENSINRAENIKLQAIKVFDDAKQRTADLNSYTNKMEQEMNKKIENIKKDFDKKLNDMLVKVKNDNKNRTERETADIIEDFQAKIQQIIRLSVEEIVKNVSPNDMKNSIKEAIIKIDFKKLTANE